MTLTTRSFLAVAVLLLFGLTACERSERESDLETDQRLVSESGLHLSQEARESIGLVTAAARRRVVPRTISASGWLMVKPEHEVVVKAAATGFVLPTADEKKPPEIGALVANGQTLASLRVFLSPQEEAQMVALKEDADILIRQSLATMQVADARYKAVKELKNRVMAAKDVMAIRESLERSRAAYEEAREKLPFLPAEPYRRPLDLKAVAIHSPLTGRVMEVHVRPRQLVIQGDPLWTIADWDLLWIKVPVFEGDLPRIDQTKAAELTVPGIKHPIHAEPTLVPQPTSAGRRTVDLLFEVENSTGRLRPGQAVAMALSTGESVSKLVVPQAAIIWDGMGGAWVYVERDATQFRRQRVQLGDFQGDFVVIEKGLDEGMRIVTLGAEALYGEEFKGQIEVEDDD